MRLIDADYAKKLIITERDKLHEWHCEAMRGGIRKALKCIEESPTVGAVNVVMCRDCKHFIWYDKDMRKDRGADGACEELERFRDGYYNGVEDRNRNDFCSRGERRDEQCNGLSR